MKTCLCTAEHPFILLAYVLFSKTVQRGKYRHSLDCHESYPVCLSRAG